MFQVLIGVGIGDSSELTRYFDDVLVDESLERKDFRKDMVKELSDIYATGHYPPEHYVHTLLSKYKGKDLGKLSSIPPPSDL